MHSCLWFSTVTAQSTYLPSTSRRDHAAWVPVRAIGRCAPQGTLLSSTGEVSARNAAALQHIRTAGILPIICTGKIPGPWQNAVTALELDAPMVFLQVFQTVVAAGLSSVQTFYTCEHAAASIPTRFLCTVQGALVRGANGEVLLEKRLTIEACEAALGITDALEATHGHGKICCLACIGGEYYCAGKSPMVREIPLGLLAHGEPEPHAVGSPLSKRLDLGAVNKFVICMDKSLPGLDDVEPRLREALGDGAVLVTYSDNKCAHSCCVVS